MSFLGRCTNDFKDESFEQKTDFHQVVSQLNWSCHDQPFVNNPDTFHKTTLMSAPPLSSTDSHEKPPLITDTYLEAASRVVSFREPQQGRGYLQRHEESSRRLAGSFATVGLEQNPENLKDFLDKKRQECHMALLESEKSTTAESQRQTIFQSADFEWEKFKAEALMIYKTAGCGMLDLLRRQRQYDGAIRNQQVANGNYPLNNEEIVFSRVVSEYNNDKIKCRSPSLSFLNRCSTITESLDRSVAELWRVLNCVIPQYRGGRQSQSMDELIQYRLSKPFQKEFVYCARKYLEQSAWFQMENRIKTTVRVPESRSPLDTDTIIAYCRQQLSSSHVKSQVSGTQFHGLPIWALIFYSVRLGALKSAVKFCNEGGESARDFSRYFVEYEKNKGFLLPASQNELRTTICRNSGEDGFKLIVLSILARAEPNQDFAQVIQSVQDWLWTKLVQIEVEDDGLLQNLTLPALQNIINGRFPQGKTDDVEAYFAFVLSAQFERAVERLFQNLKFRSHGVHMSLALRDLHLLNVDLSPESGSLLKESTVPALDFASIIRIYTNGFRRANTKTAMEYLYHLSETPAVRSSLYDHEFPNLFEFCIYRLARDGASLEALFGQLGRASGAAVQQGLVHRFIQNPSNIIIAVAQDLVQDGQLEDALVLFETAGDMVQLFQSLLHVLVDNLTCPSVPSSRKRLLLLATNYAERYRSRAGVDDVVLANFFIVLDLMTFFTLCDQKDCDKALLVIKSIKFVPLDPKDVSSMFISYRDDFLPEVRECMPYTILQTAHALVSSFALEKERIMHSRLGTDMSLQLKSINQMISGARLSDEIVKTQTSYKKQFRALLEFANKITSPQLPNLIDILVKLEATVS